ncbi:P-loop containing nucleoside triphosphate hydrolase protein [Suillus discolor]|uniref:P-loop containing nucleoside triphosphate hydrolase protein n=1 Tax=Suillus discolor TaxID=1912936 RepID=A0A9P7JZD5_9AGAM|nr:P-loop containing nucleoside triphosphate hydrolase protein [Suillus discolor]KAG2118774.1 P-loop containing nucleoside triphosphate hydrolase protein [Suillus discolor]
MSSFAECAIAVERLTYRHVPNEPPSLDNITFHLRPGSRTILVGANGAGKSTLLQILAGKRLVNDAEIRIKGLDVFRDSPPGVTFLGTEWAMNPVVRSDIVVSTFLDSVGGYRYKERRDKLLDILDVDLDWHMHTISDGERRRVQLCMGLMAPWDVLLLDEVTVDLDVMVRDELLTFLRNDSIARGATIIYATHIFDGLNSFPTHVAHMRFGSFATEPTAWPSGFTNGPLSQTPTLYNTALQWLREDREYRRELEKQGRKGRGARNEIVPSDSETFYKKYDYSH